MFKIVPLNKGAVRPIIAPAVSRSAAVPTVRDHFVIVGKCLSSLLAPAPVPFSFLFTVLFLIEKFRGKPLEESREIQFEGDVVAITLTKRDRVPRFSIKRSRSTSEDEVEKYEIMPGSWKGKKDEDYDPPEHPLFVEGVLLEEKQWIPIARGAKVESGGLIGIFDPPRPDLNLIRKFPVSTLEGFVEKYGSDISPDGIFVHLKDPWPIGYQVGLDFQLQDGSPLFSGEGTIIGTRQADPNRPDLPAGMQVRFDKLSPKNRKMLERILEALPHINSTQDVEKLKNSILEPSAEGIPAEQALRVLYTEGLAHPEENVAIMAVQSLEEIAQKLHSRITPEVVQALRAKGFAPVSVEFTKHKLSHTLSALQYIVYPFSFSGYSVENQTASKLALEVLCTEGLGHSDDKVAEEAGRCVLFGCINHIGLFTPEVVAMIHARFLERRDRSVALMLLDNILSEREDLIVPEIVNDLHRFYYKHYKR